jgi:hypothetical protein
VKKLFSKITRQEVVLAIGALVAGEQVLQDELTKGVSAGTALRAAVIAVGAVIARANVSSKATTEAAG